MSLWNLGLDGVLLLLSARLRAICVRLLFQSMLSSGFVGLALLSGWLSKQPGIHPSVIRADTLKYLTLNQILKNALIHLLWWHKEFQSLCHLERTLGSFLPCKQQPTWRNLMYFKFASLAELVSCSSLNTVPPTTYIPIFSFFWFSKQLVLL